MAFSISGVKQIPLGGQTPGMKLVTGSCSAASVTTGVVPGSTYYVRKIYAWGFTNSANTNAFKVVKTYDATTYDSDILTLTCTSGDTFDFWFIGEDNGA